MYIDTGSRDLIWNTIETDDGPINVYNQWFTRLTRKEYENTKLGRQTAWLLLRSPRTELFYSLNLYLVDHLEMTGYSAMILGQETWHGHC